MMAARQAVWEDHRHLRFIVPSTGVEYPVFDEEFLDVSYPDINQGCEEMFPFEIAVSDFCSYVKFRIGDYDEDGFPEIEIYKEFERGRSDHYLGYYDDDYPEPEAYYKESYKVSPCGRYLYIEASSRDGWNEIRSQHFYDFLRYFLDVPEVLLKSNVGDLCKSFDENPKRGKTYVLDSWLKQIDTHRDLLGIAVKEIIAPQKNLYLLLSCVANDISFDLDFPLNKSTKESIQWEVNDYNPWKVDNYEELIEKARRAEKSVLLKVLRNYGRGAISTEDMINTLSSASEILDLSLIINDEDLVDKLFKFGDLSNKFMFLHHLHIHPFDGYVAKFVNLENKQIYHIDLLMLISLTSCIMTKAQTYAHQYLTKDIFLEMCCMNQAHDTIFPFNLFSAIYPWYPDKNIGLLKIKDRNMLPRPTQKKSITADQNIEIGRVAREVNSDYLTKKLPFVCIDDVIDLPCKSGVYFVESISGDLLYIGKAKNLRNRWRGHHKLNELLIHDAEKIYYAKIPHDLTVYIEQAMIECFYPSLNRKSAINTNGSKGFLYTK